MRPRRTFGLLLVVIVLLTPVGAAHAATITVTTTSDETASNGQISLREAIVAINNAADSGDVTHTGGAYGTNDTIIIHASPSHYSASAGELQIQKPVTIQGDGAPSTIIDAAGSGRVFHVLATFASTSTITFQGVTITGGNATAMPGGGGILVDKVSSSVAVNLSIVDAVISGNTATVTTGAHECCGGGGGIYSNGGSISLTNSSVTNNTTAVTGSSASGTPHACCDGGGGIYQDYGTVTLTASIVNNNTATVSGPALYCCHGGGGIYSGADVLTVSGGSQVSGNSFTLTGSQTDIPGGPPGVNYVGNCCSGGGGIYQDTNSNASILNSTVSNDTSTINSGHCCHGGGGVYVDGGGLLIITGSTQNHNTSTVNGPAPATGTHALSHCCSGGGADATFGGITLTTSTLDSNTSNVSGGDCCSGGGAIQIDSSVPLTTLGSTISNNQSMLTGGTEVGGGAVYEDTGASARNSYTNSTISGNSTNATNAQGGGGGLYVLNGSQSAPDVLANATIAGNSASSGSGGGVLNDGGKFSAKNSIIALNSASTGNNCLGINPGVVFASLGHNLEDGTDTCGFTGAGDLAVSAASVGLGPLATNAGPTKTRALQATSAAIDAGNPSGCTDPSAIALTSDQQGVTRPDKGESSCDIGAYENQDNTLHVSVSGAGGGTISGSGLSCPGSCSQLYPPGTQVTLTATPASGSTFAGWSGGGCSGTGQCAMTMSSDQTVTGTFNTTGGGGGGGGGFPTAHLVGNPRAIPSGVTLKLSCSGPAGQSCQTTEALTSTETLKGAKPVAVASRAKKRRMRVEVGRHVATIPAGVTQTITITLNAVGKRLLNRFHKLPVTLTVTLNNNRTSTTVTTTKLTIKPQKKRKRKKNHARLLAPSLPPLGWPARLDALLSSGRSR